MEQKEQISIVERLKTHLATTPREELDRECEELKHWNSVGPTVDEYIYGRTGATMLKIKRLLVKHNIIKGDFIEEGMIYIAAGEPSKEMTDKVKWLDKIHLHCYYRDKDRLAFEALNKKYPQYKGFIYLF